MMRYGFPFLLGKFGSRKWFIVGSAMFAVSLYLLSSLIWQVTVIGNEKIPQSVIMDAAAKQGLHRFQWKFKLDEPAELARRLQAELPDMAWVGVEVNGTHLTIRVVESKKPDPKPLLSPRNLIAAKNAVITEIIAEKVRAIVKQNTYVRKGDVLISGVIGDETHSKIVVADGKVRGIVWYKSSIESPLVRHNNVQTGDSKTRGYLVIGSRALQLTGYGKVPFEKYESLVERSTVQWREWSLPFGWIKEKLMDVKTVEQQIDPAEAKRIGLARAREQLMKQSGADARIISEKILHEKTESGKVYMEVHFEVEESIAQEQPIVLQGE
jgi:similar to stage IV sporulation protein